MSVSEIPSTQPEFVFTIGDRLKKARELAKLKQADIARHFNTSISTVSTWERDAGLGHTIEVIEGYSLLTGVDPAILAGFRTGSSATVSQQVSDWMTTESGGSSDSLAQVIPFPIR